MGRSESNVIEVALDRMYREEIRYSQVLRETADADSQYRVDRINGEKNENVRLDLEDPLETISKRHHA